MVVTEPTQTVLKVFLFTDLEGSLALKTQLGDSSYAQRIAEHDRLFRECVASHGGTEQDNAGDGFFCSFDRPSDALLCALSFQQRLVGKPSFPLRVRIGLHLGEIVQLPTNSEGEQKSKLAGLAIDLAARVMGLAEGGQILLTRAAFDSARQHVLAAPGGSPIQWLAHGPYHIKGIEDPVEVFEAGIEGLSPLRAPKDSEKARRVIGPEDEKTLGWRPAIGLELPGRPGWKLDRKLGEGGFGEVWLGRHERTKELRAFKFCFQADRLRMLERELTLFRLIKEALGERTDIVRLYDVQLQSAPYFLEMEYTRGGDLQDWATAQGGIENVPLAVRLDLVAQAAEAVAAAHSIGVIHKDIKPRNILIDNSSPGSAGVPPAKPTTNPKDQQVANNPPVPPTSSFIPHPSSLSSSSPSAPSRPDVLALNSPRIRLTDFGIGQVSKESLELAGITARGFTGDSKFLTELGSRTGTRIYMAPELMTGKRPSVQSDIYSLGILLYQMVTAKLDEPLGPGWEREIPDDLLREDISACADKDPDRRLPSAKDLADRIRNLEFRRAQRESERRTKEEAEQAKALAEKAQRRRRLFAGISAASLAFAAIFLYMASRQFQLRKQAESERARAESETQRAETERTRADERADAAEYEQYVAVIQYAQKCIDEKRFNYAKETLNRAPTRLRNWEWGYLMKQTSPEVHSFLGHKGGIHSARFSLEGTKILTASEDKTARLWDATTAIELTVFSGHSDGVVSARFSSDEKRIVTASWDKTARVWDVSTSKELATLPHTSPVCQAEFTSDGLHLVTATVTDQEAVVKIWDATTYKELSVIRRIDARPDEEPARLSPDGKTVLVAVASESPNGERKPDAAYLVKCFDLSTQCETTTFTFDFRPAWSLPFFSADGKQIVGVSGNAISVFDLNSGRPIDGEEPKSPLEPGCFKFDSRGHQVLIEAAGKVYVRDISGKRKECILAPSEDESLSGILNGVISPDGRHAATTRLSMDFIQGYELNGLRVQLWDLDRATKMRTFEGHSAPISDLRFSPDGQHLLTASSDSTAKIWEAKAIHGPSIISGNATHFSKDGRRILTWTPLRKTDGSPVTSTEFVVWSVDSGAKLSTFVLPGATTWDADFSPDNRWVICWTDGWNWANGGSMKRDEISEARLFHTDTGVLKATLTGHTDAILHASVSPDGRRVITTSSDKTTRIWDSDNGKQLGEIPTGSHADRFSGDGRLFLTWDDSGTTVWDSGNFKKVSSFAGFMSEFSTDGKMVVNMTVVEIPGSKRVATAWDTATGARLFDLQLPGYGSARFSPDGARLAFIQGELGGEITVFDSKNGNPIATLSHAAAPLGVEFSPDGTRLITSQSDGTVRLWDTTNGREMLVLHPNLTGVLFGVHFSPDGLKILATSQIRDGPPQAGIVAVWQTILPDSGADVRQPGVNMHK